MLYISIRVENNIKEMRWMHYASPLLRIYPLQSITHIFKIKQKLIAIK